jgi:ubiquitin-conjugating enzyme E2 O
VGCPADFEDDADWLYEDDDIFIVSPETDWDLDCADERPTSVKPIIPTTPKVNHDDGRVKELVDSSKCALCSNFLSTPLDMPCRHKFCKGCFGQYCLNYATKRLQLSHTINSVVMNVGVLNIEVLEVSQTEVVGFPCAVKGCRSFYCIENFPRFFDATFNLELNKKCEYELCSSSSSSDSEDSHESPRNAELKSKHAHYDMLDHVDKAHLYYQNSSNWRSEVARVISKEWTIMKKALPDRVYFRSYSDRMDLQRFLVIGAAGTVYYNSYLMFDMQLSGNYPQTPPAVTFHSFGHRINPNLYNNGKVCLSLLGTWSGRDHVENWNAQQSNMLQVASSIQGLILGPEEPYYNEPGCVFSVRDADYSLMYSINALVMSIDILIKMVNSGPEELIKVIRDHFKTYAHETWTLVNYCANLGRTDLKSVKNPSVNVKQILKKYRVVFPSSAYFTPSAFAGQMKALLPALEKAICQYADSKITKSDGFSEEGK